MSAYYNEHDKFAAQWLRNLIAVGHITPGDVDERSIKDVRADDLVGYTQCHFFAGIGGWSLALRLAGWPDDRPVWTGSCPCQPFSAAGKQAGVADDRHLWPAWFELIRERRPDVVFGEQVASAIGHGWLDLVSTDMEAEDYAIGSVVLGAHSVGAPHIRQRLWFVADAVCATGERLPRGFSQEEAGERGAGKFDVGEPHRHCDGGATNCLADADGSNPSAEWEQCSREHRLLAEGGCADGAPGNHQWSDPIWLPCRDGKYRPAQSEIQPLVDGISPARVGILRGAGNAIVPQVGAEVIRAYMGCRP